MGGSHGKHRKHHDKHHKHDKHHGHRSDSESDDERKGGAAYKKTTKAAVKGERGAAAGKKETKVAVHGKGNKHHGHRSDSDSDHDCKGGKKGGAAYKKTTQAGAVHGERGTAAGKRRQRR